MKTQTWYLCRHGLATHAASYGADVLTAQVLQEGWPAVEVLAQQLAAAPKGEFYASPVLRCRQTADKITAVTGQNYLVDDRLREWQFNEDVSAPKSTIDGETFQALTDRIQAFLADRQRSQAEVIWVCAHGSILAALTHYLTDKAFTLADSEDYPPPAGLRVITAPSKLP
jgi:broad specificity phosphatase PhoE